MNIFRCFVVALFLMSASPVFAGSPAQLQLPPKRLLQNNPIDTINAQGPFTLVIKKGSQLKITASRPPANPIHARLFQQTLYIDGMEGSAEKSPLIVTVFTPHLSRLIVEGPTNVKSDRFQSDGLTIASFGTGTVDLSGKMRVNQIDQRGNNRIRLLWVDSSTLTINSRGQGEIYLAGVAKTVYARLAENAKLNAQYLRADHVNVQTQNNSAAYVLPLVTLRAFASGGSNIYYYTYPKNITLDSKQSGNVLQMAWRD